MTRRPLLLLLALPALFLMPQPARAADAGPAAIALPAPKAASKTTVEDAIARRRSIRAYSTDPLTLQQLSQLLWAAQGITEPVKGLRTAPSAVESYPIRLFLFATNVAGLPVGLYRYVPQGHKLELVTAGDQRQEAGGPANIRGAAALLAYAVDCSATRQRFGEKAPRYAAIEVGHSAQNVLLQEIALGLVGVGVGVPDAAKMKAALKLTENEEPWYIVAAGRPAGK